MSAGAPVAVRAARTGAPDGPIAVVAAMREELTGIRRRADGRYRRLEIDGAHAVLLGRRPAILLATGEGSGNAAGATARLLARVPVAGVVVLGVAGALTSDLPLAGLLVGRDVVDEDGPAPPPDPAWLEQIPHGAGIFRGTIVSRSSMLCTREAKAAARARLSFDGCAAADMESAAVAEVAARRGVPYIAVRAISDTAGEGLPLDFNRFRDASGRVDRLKVVGHSILRPGLVVPLWRLRQRVSRCAERLARLVVPLIVGESR
jgi:adenosylhomocysteine nucleosidase